MSSNNEAWSAPVPACAAPQRLSVSTDAVASRERHAFWADLVCDRLVQADCVGVREPHRFAGHIDQCLLGRATPEGLGVSVSSIRSTAQRVRRTKRHVAQSAAEQVLVNIQCSGVGRVAQGGREAVLLPGDWAVYTSDQPYELAFDAAFEQTVLIFPAQAVRALVPGLERQTAQRVPAAAPLTGLLRQAAQHVMVGASHSVAPAMEQAVLHLLAAALAEADGRKSRVPSRMPHTPRVDAPAAPTDKERQVLSLLARGFSYVEMSQHLGVAESTIRTHVRSLYSKLGAHNQAQVLFEARQWGWVV